MNLYENFKEEIESLYPDLSLDELKLICNSPFLFVKEVINRGVMKNIRLQYFGVFEVMPSRVKYSLSKLTENYENKKITTDRYLKRKEILERYDDKNKKI